MGFGFGIPIVAQEQNSLIDHSASRKFDPWLLENRETKVRSRSKASMKPAYGNGNDAHFVEYRFLVVSKL